LLGYFLGCHFGRYITEQTLGDDVGLAAKIGVTLQELSEYLTTFAVLEVAHEIFGLPARHGSESAPFQGLPGRWAKSSSCK
jgi:hypothetical protein